MSHLKPMKVLSIPKSLRRALLEFFMGIVSRSWARIGPQLLIMFLDPIKVPKAILGVMSSHVRAMRPSDHLMAAFGQGSY